MTEIDPKPTIEEKARATRFFLWPTTDAGNLEAARLALEFARIRAEEREACAEVVGRAIRENFEVKRRCGECGEPHFQRSAMSRDVANAIAKAIRGRC